MALSLPAQAQEAPEWFAETFLDLREDVAEAAKKPFMKCAHCCRRIAIVKGRATHGEPSFRVAANQKCDRVLRDDAR